MENLSNSETYYAETISPTLAHYANRTLLWLLTHIQTTLNGYFLTVAVKNETIDGSASRPDWLVAEISNGDTFCFGYSVADESIAEPYMWVSFKPAWKDGAVTILRDAIKAMEKKANTFYRLIHQIPPMPRRLPPQEEQQQEEVQLH